jgi:hypothetical protein
MDIIYLPKIVILASRGLRQPRTRTVQEDRMDLPDGSSKASPDTDAAAVCG